MATKVAGYFIKAYQARKIQIHNKIYPSKGVGTPAIREMKVEPNGRDSGREGKEKCFPTFCEQSSEQRGLAPRFHVIKTHI